MKHDHEHKINQEHIGDALNALRPLVQSSIRGVLTAASTLGERWVRAQALHAAVAWINATAVADPELAKSLDAQDMAQEFAEYIKNGA